MPMMPMMPMMLAMMPCMPAMMAAMPAPPFSLPGVTPQAGREEIQFIPVANNLPPGMGPGDDIPGVCVTQCSLFDRWPGLRTEWRVFISAPVMITASLAVSASTSVIIFPYFASLCLLGNAFHVPAAPQQYYRPSQPQYYPPTSRIPNQFPGQFVAYVST